MDSKVLEPTVVERAEAYVVVVVIVVKIVCIIKYGQNGKRV